MAKKIFVMLLVLVMLGTVLVACKGDETPEPTPDPGTTESDAPVTDTEATETDTEADGTDTEADGTEPEDSDPEVTGPATSDTEPEDSDPEATGPATSDTEPEDSDPEGTGPATSDTEPEDSQPEDSEPEDSQPEEPRVTLDLNKYTVVYDDQASNRVVEITSVFAEGLGDNIGGIAVDRWQTAGTKEILVGVTDRDESTVSFTRLNGSFTYNISLIGEKICITAATPALLEEALEYFTETYVAPASNGKIALEENLNYTPEEQRYVTVIDEGKNCLFKVVFSRLATVGTPINAASMELREFLQSYTVDSQEVTLTGDYANSAGQFDLTEYAFVIGNTDYPRSQEISQTMSYFAWHLEYVDHQLYMYCEDSSSAYVLLEEVKAMIKDGVSLDGSTAAIRIFVPEAKTGYLDTWCEEVPEYVPTESEQSKVTMDTINEFTEGYYRIYLNNVTPEGYAAYLNLVTESGYTLMQSNSVTNTVGRFDRLSGFNTFIGEKTMIHVYYVETQKAMRILVCEKSNFVEYETEAEVFEADEIVTKPSMTIMDMEYKLQSAQDNGLGLIFTLEDGSYVIYDGGYSYDTDKLYTFLTANNKRTDGRVYIRAWILTHPHEDHYGNYLAFASKYGRLVTLQYAVYQFDYEGAMNTSATVGGGFVAGLKAIITETNAATVQFIGSEKITPLEGQTMYFGNLSIEMIATSESLYPKTVSDQNEHSLISRVSLGGNTVLVVADTMNNSLQMMTIQKIFGSYLRSDFMTAPHHGLNGSQELYDLVRPAYVIFHTAEDKFEERIANGGTGPACNYQLYLNSLLPDEDSNKYVKELFYAEDGPEDGYRTLQLPFMGSDWYETNFGDGDYDGGDLDSDHWNDLFN